MFTSSISIEKSVLISTILYHNSFRAFDFESGIILYVAHTLPIFGFMLTWFFNASFSTGIECENTLISLKSTTSTNLNSPYTWRDLGEIYPYHYIFWVMYKFKPMTIGLEGMQLHFLYPIVTLGYCTWTFINNPKLA